MRGYTHDFYKYPARFSPGFVRYILNSFTEPGDYVLDPFMGGGTTIVEATALGRYVIGSDVNELAHFVTKVKTTPLSRQDIAEVRRWVRDVQTATKGTGPTAHLTKSPIRNLPVEIYNYFAIATRLAEQLRFPRRQHFVRCALVRVGQWALDARSNIPETDSLSNELHNRVESMLNGLSEFVSAAKVGGVYKNKITGTRKLMTYSAADSILVHTLRRHNLRPKLVLTSPPYPGVHVLYHRWQVFGRRETPAPYWIAAIRDGHGESHYNMGSRSAKGLNNYFRELSAAFSNLSQILAPDAKVVQLISFSDATLQLPLYLDAMDKAGFEETNAGGIDSRQVRSVPNRKWYNNQRPSNDASREFLLMHRIAGSSG